MPMTLIYCMLLILSSSTGNFPGETTASAGSLKTAVFSGTGYDLGMQHGRKFRKEIAEIVLRWKINTAGIFGRDADSIVTEFFDYADFDASIMKWTPDLYEEIRGIAEGSGQAFNDIFILNLLDEFWVWIDARQKHHCSDMGVPARNGEPGHVAQNMDIERYTDGYQTLIRLERTENRPEQLILTHPGLIALNGMNESGVGICVNTLMQLKASSTGLPVAFIVRRLINSTDKSDILDFIQNTEHASGQNYIIGIRGEVFDFEASANKVVRFDPNNDNGAVYHTNHPLVNDDVKEWYKAFDPSIRKAATADPSNSEIRFTALSSRLQDAELINDELIKEALRSKDDGSNPVCRNPEEGGFGFTFASTIMSLGENPILLVSPGPPDVNEYQQFEF